MRKLLRTHAQARPPSGLVMNSFSDMLQLMAGFIRPLTVGGMKSLSHHLSLETRSGNLLLTRAAPPRLAAQRGVEGCEMPSLHEWPFV